MTAMRLIPTYVRESITDRKEGVREDLLAIEAAEADGWTVTFKDGSWANPAIFRKSGAVVWLARSGWRRAHVTAEGRHSPPEVFPTLADALANNVEALMGRRLA